MTFSPMKISTPARLRRWWRGRWRGWRSVAIALVAFWIVITGARPGLSSLPGRSPQAITEPIAQTLVPTESYADRPLETLSPEELEVEIRRLIEEAMPAYNTGNRAEALRGLERLMAIYELQSNRERLGVDAAWMSSLYIGVGDFERALEWLDRYEQLALEVAPPESLAAFYDNRGLAFAQLGEYQPALAAYDKAITYIERGENLGMPARTGYTWNKMAAVHNRLGESDRAIALFEKSFALAERVEDDALTLQTADYLGKFERERGSYAVAEDYQERALELAEAFNVQMREYEENYYSTIANLPPEQRALIPDAPRFVRRLYEAQRLANLAHTYAAWEKPDRARDFAERAYNLASEDINGEPDNTDFQFFDQTMGEIGVTFRVLGDYPRAEEILREAIEVQERVRADQFQEDDRLKVLFSDAFADVFEEMQLVLVAQGKNLEALEISERGRARAFVELISERLDAGRTDAIAPPTLDGMRQLARKLDTTIVEYSPIDSAQQLLIWVVSPDGEIRFENVDYSTLEMSLEHLIFAARCQNRVCLRHVLGRTRGSFTADSETLQAYATPPEPYTASQPSQQRDVNPYLKQLHDLTIAPIADRLPTDPNARIAISPQGSLFLIPFAALQDDTGAYLIERHTLLTTPSIQVLDRTNALRDTVTTSDALVVGNPTMPDNLSPLEGAESEARAIAQILNTQPLTGNDATEAKIRSNITKSRVVHLATHGTFDERDGLRSAIAFAPTADLDGWITSKELLELDMNAEMVVLSACSTGRGRITGDGVVGLSRSLVASGAASVVVSLWDVDDGATEALMSSFYDAWARTNLDKAQALRVAMLETMEDYPHPFFWSAFTFIGEPL
ncbi:MAG: CHAT domain-containing protein [Geitlerinemataceae cyanobacterium]